MCLNLCLPKINPSISLERENILRENIVSHRVTVISVYVSICGFAYTLGHYWADSNVRSAFSVRSPLLKALHIKAITVKTPPSKLSQLQNSSEAKSIQWKALG